MSAPFHSKIQSNARTLARLLGGEVAGHNKVLCPGPGHSRRDRSLQVTLSDDADDGFLVHSFAGDDWRTCRDEVRGRLGLSPRAPIHERRIRQHHIVGKPPQHTDHLARAIWNEAIDAHNTPVERYLASRHLTLPPGAEALRFHPACPFAGTKTPAMVALVRNIDTNEPQGIHRTALDCREINRKMSLGPTNGGAIKLTPDEDVTIALGIAEGIESALSLQCLPEWFGSPVWSVISASGIRNFPLLAGIETLVIAADNDAAGEDATIEVSERWQEREVLVIEAQDDGADLNDILQGETS
jgi:Toprim domain-containing protein